MRRLGNPFLIAEITGGLGNQLFQFAAAEAVRQRDDRDLYFAWYQPRKSTRREFVLDRYAGIDKDKQLLSPMDLRRLGLRSIGGRKRTDPRRLAKHGIELFKQKGFAYEPIPPNGDALVIDGFFQSWRYFSDFSEVIRQELTLREGLSPAKAELLAEAQNRHSVCLHIRRGDYVNDARTQAVHGSLRLDHYAKALELLGPPETATVFVFTDDPGWARAHVRVPHECLVVEPNHPDEPWQDLAVMAACQDFVIANSSFSWWGAWLSTRPGKQVLAPRRWFVGSDRDSRDLCPPEWQQL